MKIEDAPETEKARRPLHPDVADEVTGTRTVQDVGDDLRRAVNACRRCSLWRAATQGVPGEGAAHATIMLVGEAPGDVEDIQGHPFVGPAGAVLDRALHDSGLDRESIFLTNAVKHFKFELRGKRRLHVKPTIAEIKACNWWLTQEMRLVEPKLVIALGATAARAILGRTVTISSVRAIPTPISDKTHAWMTIHPSWLLRLPEENQRRSEYMRFVQELKNAKAWLESRGAN